MTRVRPAHVAPHLSAIIALCIVALAPATTAVARAPSPSDQTQQIAATAVHLVVDISGSMLDPDPTGRVKMEGAKSALLQFLDGLQLGTAIGLRTYPDQKSVSCNSGLLRYPLERQDPEDVSAVVRSLQPNGDTPTAEALLAAADDVRESGFPAATIVLVSDGESTCADPCDAAATIVASGLQIQVIAVGFQISAAGAQQLECIARTTGGRYVDIDDSDELAQIFVDISVPRLTVSVDNPSEVVAEVGFESSGVVSVRATVRNEGQTVATNVQARLQFETASPGTVAPVRALGNIDAGVVANTATWTFRPGLLLAGTTVKFSVIVRADNLPSDVGQDGSVRVLDPTLASEAGPFLTGKRLAILGDSYSAGEGADEYFPETDTPANTCHRSKLTYAVSTFNIPNDAIMACSGAVTSQIDLPDTKNGIPSQTDQLRDYQTRAGPVDAVVLTIGGNDVKFAKVAESCIFGDCSAAVDGVPSEQFLVSEMGTLGKKLRDAYGAINSSLNSAEMVAKRGGMAAIIVLGYPRPAPSVDRPCLGLGLDLGPLEFDFSADDLVFVNRYVTLLNGEIEGAVEAVRKVPGKEAPVFYVPYAEDSFLPDHTVCDRVPYARGLDSFNGAALHFKVSLKDFLTVINPFTTPQAKVAALIKRFGPQVVEWFGRGKQEFFHPNPQGYQAMTSALIRWSRTTEADEVAAFLATAPPPEQPKICDPPLSSTILALQGSSSLGTLQPCTTYTLRVTGFAPADSVVVRVNSTPITADMALTDATGSATAYITLPNDFESGTHTVVVSGVDANGVALEQSAPFQVDAPGPPLAPLMMGGSGIALVALGSVSYLVGRRKLRKARLELSVDG
jgi:lysophospholipase L1-like esterase